MPAKVKMKPPTSVRVKGRGGSTGLLPADRVETPRDEEGGLGDPSSDEMGGGANRAPASVDKLQNKAAVMASAMARITTRHVRDVCDFSKCKKNNKRVQHTHDASEDLKPAKRNRTDTTHTPAQLRVMQKRRQSSQSRDHQGRDKPRDLTTVKRQAKEARMRYLTEAALPMSLNGYIHL